MVPTINHIDLRFQSRRSFPKGGCSLRLPRNSRARKFTSICKHQYNGAKLEAQLFLHLHDRDGPWGKQDRTNERGRDVQLHQVGGARCTMWVGLN